MRLAKAALCALLIATSLGAAPPQSNAAAPVDSGCGVSGGTLTMLATDNQSDFAAFSLIDPNGDEMARQFIPMYTQDATAELMLTSMGFGQNVNVASVRCLADSSIKRCGNPKWQSLDEGVSVNFAGILMGPDWMVVTVKGRYVNVASPIAGSIDGAGIGFQLDKTPVRWSSLYDSQTEASQAFYGIGGGDHTLTIGWRDPDKDALFPEDRLCFNL